MQYAGLLKNDFSAAPGVSVSFYTQGCRFRCEHCHNPETWDFNGGLEFTPKIIDEIIEALTANGIQRNLCILGGEPLCPENEFLTYLIISSVKEKLPDVNVYIWTGYYFKDIPKSIHTDQILSMTHCIIDGPYIHSKRDITLQMRGSSNQNIIYL